MEFLNKKSNFKNGLFFVFRVLVGLLFMQHGAQKLFGLLGGQAAPLFSLMGLAGVIEFFGGLFVAVGLFTSWVALLAAVQMLVAYFMVHAKSGFFPIANKGELSLLFFVAFLALFVLGGGKFSLDKLFFKKEY